MRQWVIHMKQISQERRFYMRIIFKRASTTQVGLFRVFYIHFQIVADCVFDYDSIGTNSIPIISCINNIYLAVVPMRFSYEVTEGKFLKEY